MEGDGDTLHIPGCSLICSNHNSRHRMLYARKGVEKGVNEMAPMARNEMGLGKWRCGNITVTIVASYIARILSLSEAPGALTYSISCKVCCTTFEV